MRENERLRVAVRSVPAPLGLETRIRSSIREPQRRTRSYSLPVAAALLVSVGAAIAYQLGHLLVAVREQDAYIASISSRVAGVMRAGLGDHVHCTVYRKFPQDPPTFQEMTRELGPEYAGLVPLVKDRAPANLQIVMAHRCSYRDRKFVHLALRGDSRLLSLVIADKEDGESFTKENLAPALTQSGIAIYRAGVERFQIAGFESRDHLVYVVSDLAQHKNMEILTALAPAVTDLLLKLKS